MKTRIPLEKIRNWNTFRKVLWHLFNLKTVRWQHLCQIYLFLMYFDVIYSPLHCQVRHTTTSKFRLYTLYTIKTTIPPYRYTRFAFSDFQKMVCFRFTILRWTILKCVNLQWSPKKRNARIFRKNRKFQASRVNFVWSENCWQWLDFFSITWI